MMRLHAGDLSMVYDKGFLRYIKLGNYEVLRMIYFALRDHNWDTMPGVIVDEKLDIRDRSFDISYTWKSTMSYFPFYWQVHIKGTEHDQVVFAIDGKATADVRKNRTGFCILHSVPENMGKVCRITAPDGKIISGKFPRYISPHQPFKDIARMEWPMDEFGHASLVFSGDVFEMEDQRNWTDDSYKTYCTPLAEPFPVLLKKEEKVRQTVDLMVDKKKAVTRDQSGGCTLSIGKTLDKKPSLGIAAASRPEQLSRQYVENIAQLDFDIYQIEVDFSSPSWREYLHARLNECQLLNLKLRAVLFFTDNYPDETHQFLKEVRLISDSILTDILVLSANHKSTPSWLIDDVEPVLRKGIPDVAIGAGTNAYFTELNRERVETDRLDFVSYSVNPQVHAFDDDSLVECSIAQVYTVESAHHYFAGKNVHVAPVTLKPRFNPNATSVAEPPDESKLPDIIDARQWSLFGAGWTLSSILSLAKSGADCAIYYQTVGLTGLMKGPDAQLTASHDLEVPEIYPLYHVFDLLLSHKKSEWIVLESSDPLSCCGVAFKTEKGFKLLIANLKDQPVMVGFANSFHEYRLMFLDEFTVPESDRRNHYFEEELEEYNFREGSKLPLNLPSNALAYAEII